MNSEFKEKKTVYFEKVRNNFDIFQNLMDNNKGNDNSEVLLMPKTEEEVDIADAILTYMIDASAFLRYIIDGNLESKPLEENYAYNLYTNLINALKDNNDMEVETIKKFIEIVPPKEKAKYVFDALSCSNDSEEMMKSLCKNTGFDPNDELSIMQFNLYFEKAKHAANIGYDDIKFRNMSRSDKRKVVSIVEMVKELHIMIDKEINKDKEMKREI